ncbi:MULTISPECIES: hypothetical protein [unclassified Streptomyces]
MSASHAKPGPGTDEPRARHRAGAGATVRTGPSMSAARAADPTASPRS